MILSTLDMRTFIQIAIVFALFIQASSTLTDGDQSIQKQDAFYSKEPLWSVPEGELPIGNKYLLDLLQRIGPNMRASSEYHDFTDIQLNETLEAWKLMHKQAQLFAQNQVHFYAPKVIKLFREANTSHQCQSSIEITFQAIEQLKTWAVQMWGSTGEFPPTAFLAGDFTDLGSYHACINLKTESSSINFTSYCTLPYRPVVPSRPQFHQIFHEHEDIKEVFNGSDIFGELARHAQYFHYLYLRTGVCVPSSCSPKDMQQVLMLVARRLGLMSGPVKCFTRAPSTNSSNLLTFNLSKIENEPTLVELEVPMNRKQRIAGLTILTFLGLVILSTVWHLLTLVFNGESCSGVNFDEEELEGDETFVEKKAKMIKPITVEEHSFPQIVAFQYLSLITNGKNFLDTSTGPKEIKCLHGLRVLTMLWIIVVHTLQYNEWSGFFRVFDTVKSLQNPFLHPIYNANYTVDNFFFMSGLLVAYTSWCASKSSSKYTYNVPAQIIGRYLRLTPQVLLISLLYMLLPFIGNSPFWYDMSAQASWKCQENWWINLLHIQSFYKEAEMCNLVSWYISVDMLFYVISLPLVYMILNKKKARALILTILYVGFCLCNQAYRHYTGKFTPNNLGTVPQVDEVWSQYVVYFFWSPYPHAYPFFLGLWFGYLLATNRLRKLVRDWSRLGWLVCSASLLLVNLSSHIWMSGAVELGSQYISTIYNLISAIIWSSAFAWIVIACHYGCAKWFDNLLSIKPFILLSKASFIIYLSHMLVVRMYFGLQNGLLEVSIFTMTYAILGNILISIVFGVFLCISFEGPCLKFQKLILRKIKPANSLQSAPFTSNNTILVHVNQEKTIRLDNGEKVTINMGPTGNTLLK